MALHSPFRRSGLRRFTRLRAAAAIHTDTSHSQRAYLQQELFRIAREQENENEQAYDKDAFERALFGERASPMYGGEPLISDRIFDRVEAEMRDSFERMERMSREAEERASRTGAGPQTYRKESSSEESFAGGGYRRTYSSESVTVWTGNGGAYNASASSQMPGNFFGTAAFLALAVVYARGCRQFWDGYSRTVYKEDEASQKAVLTLGWPVLRALSSTYRAEFDKATKTKGTTTTEDPNP
ncbi:hypothetical protein RI054_13g63900 [Pseudoscourfieldia marina]